MIVFYIIIAIGSFASGTSLRGLVHFLKDKGEYVEISAGEQVHLQLRLPRHRRGGLGFWATRICGLCFGVLCGMFYVSTAVYGDLPDSDLQAMTAPLSCVALFIWVNLDIGSRRVPNPKVFGRLRRRVESHHRRRHAPS